VFIEDAVKHEADNKKMSNNIERDSDVELFSNIKLSDNIILNIIVFDEGN
jgi:hypothetical protein